jgi:hypothetical protein
MQILMNLFQPIRSFCKRENVVASRIEYEVLMTEIQLRAIVQNMDKQDADQQTNGDKVMVKGEK